MYTKSCVYKMTTCTEKRRTECLTFLFLISYKKVIEDTVRASWHLISTRIDHKLNQGCSNISKALSWNNYILIAILWVPIDKKCYAMAIQSYITKTKVINTATQFNYEGGWIHGRMSRAILWGPRCQLKPITIIYSYLVWKVPRIRGSSLSNLGCCDLYIQ